MLVRALLAVLFLSSALVAPGASAGSSCPGRTTSGSWTTVRVPTFASGAASAKLHAVSASQPDLLYVSNGRTVLRSIDGGCRWTTVLDLPAAPTSAMPFTPGARIVAMAAPEAAAGGRHVHLLVNDTPQEVAAPPDYGPLSAGLGAPRTLSSEDAGATWRTSAPLTPTAGTRRARCSSMHYCVLTVAPSDPRVLYVGLSPNGLFTPAVLLRSADAGRSWEPRTAPNDYLASAGTPGGIEVIEVDPLKPDTIWAEAGLSTFSRSTDGGRTWRYLDSGYDFRLPALDVYAAPGKPSRLVALQSGDLSQRLDRHGRSTDGGATWSSQDPASVGLTAVHADGIAHGNRSDDVVVSLTRPAGLRGWSPRARRYVDLDPTGLLRRHAPVSDVQATRERRPRFVLLGKDVLLTYRGPVGADIPVRTTTVPARR